MLRVTIVNFMGQQHIVCCMDSVAEFWAALRLRTRYDRHFARPLPSLSLQLFRTSLSSSFDGRSGASTCLPVSDEDALTRQ